MRCWLFLCAVAFLGCSSEPKRPVATVPLEQVDEMYLARGGASDGGASAANGLDAGSQTFAVIVADAPPSPVDAGPTPSCRPHPCRQLAWSAIDSLSLSRGNYTVVVRRNGHVEWQGDVVASGKVTRTIPSARVRRLFTEAGNSCLLDMKARYHVGPTHHGTATTTIRAGRIEKTIEHYLGGMDGWQGDECQAPLELTKVEDLIDEVAGTEAAIGNPTSGDTFCNPPYIFDANGRKKYKQSCL